MDNTTHITILLSILVRWIVSLYPYSGFQKPPMYGDYEAQRHWMEITINLSPSEWYRNSTNNDILYWGLDYPPLTAYHSFIMGKVAQWINSDWVELFKSRGYESYHHKLYMRSTVMISDLFVYMTALYFYWTSKEKETLNSMHFLRSLLVPSLILIDYGHFQYNTITLGLFIWTVISLQNNCDLWAAFMFSMALNYKQMALYYSLPIFLFLLKRCFVQRSLVRICFKFICLAMIVLSTFAILWWPYLTSLESTLQVVQRIFPLNRGIYEDKVANFWYCLSIIVKFKNIFNKSQLAFGSAFSTLLVSLPSCYLVFIKNSLDMLKYALFTVSLSFFMFSFQVHEKTILFANSALILLYDKHPLQVCWFSLISTFSLQPLLIKDELMIPYFALCIVYIVINPQIFSQSHLVKFGFGVSLLGCTTLSVAALVIEPPSRYPHIHSLLNCLFSFAHFVAFYLYFLYKQIQLSSQSQSNQRLTLIKEKKTN